VEVPGPEQEKPRFGRVGIIAAVGFVIGMLWPRLAGVKLVPTAPAPEEQPAVVQPAPSAAPKHTNAAPALAKPAVVAPAPKPEPAQHLKISDPQVTSCRDKAGERLAECDRPDVDRFARSHLLALAACPAAAQARGLLSLGLDLDLSARKVKGVVKGKSTTMDSDRADALIDCAEASFSRAVLDGLEHTAAAYTVFYRIEFLPQPAAAAPAASVAEPDSETAEASGRATVIWEVAILRATPTKDGSIVARVLQGTRLVVTGRQADWYKVKYDAKGSEGWVFRTAIGL
jgi:hypothetical protein